MKSRVWMGSPCSFSTILFASIFLGSSLFATTPEAPGNLNRSNYIESPRAITLGWQDNSNDETVFFIQWSADGGATWETFGQVGDNVTSCSAGLPAAQVLYLFRVFASDGTDSSGFSNIISVEGTDPSVADTDGDGIKDGYEITHGLDPYVEDSYEDVDGDRYPNIFEYAKATNPNDDESVPAADFVVDAGAPVQGNVVATVQAALDQVTVDYQIIRIRDGVFQGTGNTNLVFPASHPILLLSETGARETILDGGSVGQGLTLATSSVIDGLTIRNARAVNGAAVYISGGAPLFVNSVLVGNQAQESGGAIYQEAGNCLLVHTTLRNNQATTGGSGVHVESGTLSADKSILWDAGSVSEIEVAVGATCEVTESIVRGGYSGSGNSSNDPLLRADGHLTGDSPAIDSGGTLQTALLDLDGEVRPSGSTTDVGADEWVDSDSNALPDWWELLQFGELGNLSSSDPDGDGLTNQQEYQQSSNPNNYYSQGGGMIMPTVTVTNGNHQMPEAGAFTSQPVQVRVSDAIGLPLANAPVQFAMLAGAGQLASSNTGAPMLADQMDVQTNAEGYAQFYVKLPNQPGATVNVRATAGGTVISSLWAYTSGLAAWWKYEEASGTTALDVSSNGRNGTLLTGASRPSGPLGQCLAVNGSGMYRSNTGYGLFPGNNAPFSLSFWFKANTIPATNHSALLDHETYLTNGFRCSINSYANPPKILFWSTQSGGTVYLTSSTTAETGKWYHVVVVYEPDNARLYVNGIQEAVDTTALIKSNQNTLRVGYGIGGHLDLNGQMDEVHVYHGALTAGEIAALNDTDSDGMPDWWEMQHFEDLEETATGDPDGDGLTNLQEYQQGNDPNDYFSQGGVTITPAITIVSGNNQIGQPDSYTTAPLVVKVVNASNPAQVLPNAPVQFMVTSGTGLLDEDTELPVADSSFFTRTDNVQALAQANYLFASGARENAQITAQTGGQSVIFYLTSLIVPSAPSGLQASVVTPSQVDLTWIDNADNEESYKVERSPDGINFTEIASALPANTTSYSDQGLNELSQYHYRVTAFNAAGSSAYGELLSVNTPFVDTENGGTGDGLADSWEMQHFGDLEETAMGDPDGDGLTNQQEYQQSSNPNNYYSQGGGMIMPTVTVTNGNHQMPDANAFTSQLLQVRVTDSVGLPLANAPVQFAMLTGGGQLAASNTGALCSDN